MIPKLTAEYLSLKFPNFRIDYELCRYNKSTIIVKIRLGIMDYIIYKYIPESDIFLTAGDYELDDYQAFVRKYKLNRLITDGTK